MKKEPDPLLWMSRLRSLLSNPECGLVVDGLWGETELLFPFAVYEAKKGIHTSGEEAEKQVFHAFKTYLAMLDDLARNPDDINQYQTEESSRFQMFAFTSSGPQWKIYVAWSSNNECVSDNPCSPMRIRMTCQLAKIGAQMVKPVWEGDIQRNCHTLELIYIMDQIHDYAIKKHRPFVLNHLKTWYAWNEKHPLYSVHHYGFGHCEKKPPWQILDEAAKESRQKKSRVTRKRNRPDDDLVQTSGVDAKRKVKRKRVVINKLETEVTKI